MKRKIKFLLTFFLPIMLLVGGCSLFNEDDGSNETQEEMFDKYLTAAGTSIIAKDYTVITSLENPNDIREISITKTKDKYIFKEVGTHPSSIEEKFILKQEGNKYIEYSNMNGTLSSSYITIDNFDVSHSLTSNTYVDLEILGYKTDVLIKNYVENILSNQFDVIESSEKISFNIEKNNGEYIMKVEANGMGKVNGKSIKSSVNLKISFNTKNVTKVSMETSKVEINADGSDKDGGYSEISKSNQSIKYSFDESLVMIDFSKYPTP